MLTCCRLKGYVELGPDSAGQEYAHWSDMVHSKDALPRWHRLRPLSATPLNASSATTNGNGNGHHEGNTSPNCSSTQSYSQFQCSVEKHNGHRWLYTVDWNTSVSFYNKFFVLIYSTLLYSMYCKYQVYNIYMKEKI